jgi:hypothetical protein
MDHLGAQRIGRRSFFRIWHFLGAQKHGVSLSWMRAMVYLWAANGRGDLYEEPIACI